MLAQGVASPSVDELEHGGMVRVIGALGGDSAFICVVVVELGDEHGRARDHSLLVVACCCGAFRFCRMSNCVWAQTDCGCR